MFSWKFEMITKLSLQTHSTALKFVEPNFLLEGSGGFLNIFDVRTGDHIDCFDLFRGSRIHGIKLSSSSRQILIFGAKSLALLAADWDPVPEITVTCKWHDSDWILDAEFTTSEKSVVLLTSHNRVHFWDLTARTRYAEILCEEHCILYSGRVLIEPSQDIILLSGTVFGELLIWSVEENSSKIYHRISCHKGAVFSINYDRLSNTILTTSDDRSLKAWKIKSETLDRVENLWPDSRVELHHKFYGHEARVWRSVFIGNSAEDSQLVASLGEDSKICIWNLVTGRLVANFEGHHGSSIWAGEWIPSLESMATGGGDGSVRVWNKDRFFEAASNNMALDRDTPRLITTANDSYILLGHEGIVYTRTDSQWVPVLQDDLLKDCWVLDKVGDCIVFGTMSGSLLVLYHSADTRLDKIKIGYGKVFSIHLLGSGAYLACLDSGRMQLGQLAEGNNLTELILPDSKQRWPTCAVLQPDALLVGDREGSLHLYNVTNKDLVQSFDHVHGKTGVTDIKQDPSDQCHIYTCGKDGNVRLWYLSVGGSVDPCLRIVSVVHSGLGWISRLIWMEQRLVYLAFHGDSFIVWSTEQQRSLMQVSCGGGHRSWDLKISDNNVTFLFIKDKKVYANTRSVQSVMNTTLKFGGHSRSVCAAKFISVQQDEAGNCWPLIITGSEDTTMRISRFRNQSLQCLAVVPKHISSVRALCLKQVHDPETQGRSWICVSGGGRAQLCLGILQHTRLLGQERLVYNDLANHYLRGLLNRRAYKPWSSSCQVKLTPDPETRYMDVGVMDSGDGQLHVFAACSDSLIRIFHANLKTRRFEPTCEWDFHHCCVLKLRIVKVSPSESILVSTATDGCLAIWNVSDQMQDENHKPFWHEKLHQSGINSFDCVFLSQDRLLVLTGGDDNALSLSEIAIDFVKNKATILSRCRSPMAHAAQICGVALLNPNSDNFGLAISVSLDQRLALWKLENGSSFTLMQCVCCDVSDIQGLDTIRVDPSEILVCVHGQGIQTLRIKHAL